MPKSKHRGNRDPFKETRAKFEARHQMEAARKQMEAYNDMRKRAAGEVGLGLELILPHALPDPATAMVALAKVVGVNLAAGRFEAAKFMALAEEFKAKEVARMEKAKQQQAAAPTIVAPGGGSVQ